MNFFTRKKTASREPVKPDDGLPEVTILDYQAIGRKQYEQRDRKSVV